MFRARLTVRICTIALGLGLLACGGTPGTPGQPGPERPGTPGQVVNTTLPAEEAARAALIQTDLGSLQGLSAEGFASKYSVQFTPSLGYDPLSAQRLDLVQASSLALNGPEQSALAQNGFVISERRRFPSFVYGYSTIYMADLPLYVSADSILYAVHESYDAILASLEVAALSPTLNRLLESMRGALASGAGRELPSGARAHADLYLSVAKSCSRDASRARSPEVTRPLLEGFTTARSPRAARTTSRSSTSRGRSTSRSSSRAAITRTARSCRATSAR